MRVFTLPPLLLVIGLALSGCDSPSPQFFHGERREVMADGMSYTVFRVGNEVEVYRTNPMILPRLSLVFAGAKAAIAKATGCAVKDGSLEGDAALMRARLDCG